MNVNPRHLSVGCTKGPYRVLGSQPSFLSRPLIPQFPILPSLLSLMSILSSFFKTFYYFYLRERERNTYRETERHRETDTWEEGVHTCHDAYMEVRGQLNRFGSLHHLRACSGNTCLVSISVTLLHVSSVQRWSMRSGRAFPPEHSLLGNGGPGIRMLTSPFMGNILLTDLKPHLASCGLAHHE